MPDAHGAWGHINLFAECGPLTDGGLLDIEPYLSDETLDAIIREAGAAIERHYRATWSRVGEEAREADEAARARYQVMRRQRLEKIGNGDLRCVACGATESLTIDHILPRSRGGTDAGKNLQLLCNTCNTSKGNKTMDEWRGEQP